MYLIVTCGIIVSVLMETVQRSSWSVLLETRGGNQMVFVEDSLKSSWVNLTSQDKDMEHIVLANARVFVTRGGFKLLEQLTKKLGASGKLRLMMGDGGCMEFLNWQEFDVLSAQSSYVMFSCNIL